MEQLKQTLKKKELEEKRQKELEKEANSALDKKVPNF